MLHRTNNDARSRRSHLMPDGTVINVQATEGHVYIRATRGGLETLKLMIESVLQSGKPSTITADDTGEESFRLELDEGLSDV